MRYHALSVLGVALLLGGCAGSRIESGAVINTRTTARLDVTGTSPEISIRNAGSAPLPLEIGWGASARSKEILEPGVDRWWNPDGPRSFWFINESDTPIAVTYAIEDGDMKFVMPAE